VEKAVGDAEAAGHDAQPDFILGAGAFQLQADGLMVRLSAGSVAGFTFHVFLERRLGL
jgi:hypothetical protein